MNAHFEVLEFPKIVWRLSRLSFSEEGRETCLALKPVLDLERLETLQAETGDALELLRSKGAPPLNGLASIARPVERASRGACLSIAELQQIGVFLRTVERLHDWCGKQIDEAHDDEEAEKLRENSCIRRMERLQGNADLAWRLERAIISDEELHDQASPELARLRRAKRLASQRVRDALESILQKQEGDLQERLITQRDGRYVVPVRSDRRQAVPGILHDSSASGQTIFVEPMAVVEANNHIRELEAQEAMEIQRILETFSAEVGRQAPTFLADASEATALDVQWAKASLADQMRATRPLLGEDGVIELKAARHPLIDPRKVVPVDLYVGEEFKTLVITGPNTGGKTVALKTIGLLTLMAMSGLHIPADEGSRVSTFEKIFADIGDDQSIEQNLSTFSAHMTRMVRICDQVNERSLVLSDELGSGTDPAEGAALAVAILDYLRNKGAVTVATTHYKELKLYALSTEGVENAACEFDVETLQPTYRIQIGVPGVSNAFVISQKLGLDPEILVMAQSQMSEEGLAFERVVNRIESQRIETERVLDQERKIRNQLLRERRQLRKEREDLQSEREELLHEATAEGRKAWSEQIEALDELVAELRREMDKGSYQARDAIREAEVLRREAHAGRKSLSEVERRARDEIRAAEEEEDFVPGHYYKVRDSGLRGKLVEIDEGDQEALLTVGNLQMRVPLKDLERSSAPTPARSGGDRKRGRKARQARRTGVQNIKSELMLLGKRASEAEQLLDQYLDDAVLAGMGQVRIVHGKGTGALRKVCHDFLKKDRRVKSFELADYGEGDAGVTVVELR